MFIDITSAPSLFPANSKELWVLVEGSKNKLICVFPLRISNFLFLLLFSLINCLASLRMKLMAKKDIKLKNSRVLVLGITFKENCPDVRNTRVIDIIQDLKEYGAQVSVYDPQADAELVKLEYDIELLQHLEDKLFDAIVLAVAHREFEQIDLEKLKANTAVVYDVKGFLTEGVDGRL